MAESRVGKPPELTRRERRKLEVRSRIIAAARDLFRAQGFSATRVTEICERADVAEKTFFNHFPTKQGVLGDLASSAVEELLLSIEVARKTGRSTSERLEIFFRALADTMSGACTSTAKTNYGLRSTTVAWRCTGQIPTAS